MSRPLQLILVAVGAFLVAIVVDRLFDDGRLSYPQLLVMVASVVALWAWKRRVRR